MAKFDGVEAVHYQRFDPGTKWVKDESIAIDSPTTHGEQNMLTPNVVKMPRGGFRMYYTQMDQVQDYGRSSGHIRSAASADGVRWERESGVRIDVHEPHATQRTLCPDVIPLCDGRFRMYFESMCPNQPSTICSAVSDDGFQWTPEPSVRLASATESYGAPRCLYLNHDKSGSRFRLYCQRYSYPFRAGLDAGNQIVSAVSPDGLEFVKEPGVRIAQENDCESYANNGPEVMRLGSGGYRMYWAAWRADPIEARIFTATSQDGLKWHKHPQPCIDIGGRWDTLKASEPCMIDLPGGRCRMFYEASDAAGQWRILSATAVNT